MFSLIFKAIGFIFWSLVVVPAQWLILRVHRGRYSYIMPKLWHWGLCQSFGIERTIVGRPYTGSQVLYMSNHLSYLDIVVLGSIIPNASFVSKNDVANWPVWGFLSKLQQTAFISRGRGDTKKEANALDTMLEGGKNLILFPEGTSTDGTNVLEFKSSLFSIAMRKEVEDIMIQPVTLEVLEANGKQPETQEERDIYCWHRGMDEDITLDTHLLAFAKTSGAHLRITFHSPVQAKAFSDRKTLAKACYETVSNGLTVQHAA